MPSGRYVVVAVALAAPLAVVIATRTHLGGEPPAAVVATSHASVRPPTEPMSCKPRPPLHVEVAAASAAGGDLWTLQLHSADSDRDVVVWMRSGPSDRRVVWRGRLAQGTETRVDVRFAVPATAGQVWAEVEPAAQPGSEMTIRGEAVAGVPGRAGAELAAEARGAATGRVRVNPQTGEGVLEFPAQVETSSGSDSGSHR